MRTLMLIALVALVGCSGGEPSEPSEPKFLITQLGLGSGFLCPTENMVLRIEESIESRNRAKMDLLVKQGCFGAEANVLEWVSKNKDRFDYISNPDMRDSVKTKMENRNN